MSEIPVVGKLVLVGTAAMALMLAASPNMVSSTPRTSTTAAQAQDVDSVYFLNPRVGWASVDSSARLLMTTDGGAHWRDVSPPMLKRKGLALANGLAGAGVSQSPPTSSSACTSQNHLKDSGRCILLSRHKRRTQVDRGRLLPRKALATAWVSFQNDQQGWVAIGNGAAGGTFTVTIYDTTSGGAHWVMVSRSMSLGGKAGTPDNPSGCGDTGLVCFGNLACARSLAHRVFRK